MNIAGTARTTAPAPSHVPRRSLQLRLNLMAVRGCAGVIPATYSRLPSGGPVRVSRGQGVEPGAPREIRVVSRRIGVPSRPRLYERIGPRVTDLPGPREILQVQAYVYGQIGAHG